MIELIGAVIVIVAIKLVYNYFDKNDKWSHVDQFGHFVWPSDDDGSKTGKN